MNAATTETIATDAISLGKVTTAKDREDDVIVKVLRVLHQKPGTPFRIARVCRIDGGEMVVLGSLPDVGGGEELKLSGVWESSEKYGARFRVELATVEQPTTEEGLVECLSRMVDGVGPGLARKFVTMLGGVRGAIEFLTHPHGGEANTSTLTGVKTAKLFELRAVWQARAAENATDLGLASLGLSPSIRNKIRARYGVEAVTVCRTRPYDLAFGIEGVGFKRSDEIARAVGVGLESDARKEAALLFALREDAGSDGHVFSTKEQARLAMRRLCEVVVTDEDVDAASVALEKRGLVVLGRSGSVGLTYLIKAEKEIAGRLRDLTERRSIQAFDIGEAEQASGLSLTEEQREAVSLVAMHQVSIITGGPGVGKSTVTKTVCELLELAEIRFKLAAPTGRAARRLAEATGREASTIHKMLSYDPTKGGFVHDRGNRLPIDALLLDESSMIDVELMRSVLLALPDPCRLIFVGDADQLPPVGPGAPFRDIVASGLIPTARLETIHRQAAGSRIVQASREVLAGRAPAPSETGDRSEGALFVVEETDAEKLRAMIVWLVSSGVALSFPWCEANGVQVVSPQRKGPLGVDVLNVAIQAAVNPRPPEECYLEKRGHDREVSFRIGDRVMQTKNDYRRGVVNGELGTIAEMLVRREGDRDAPVLSVRYVDGEDERIVTYAKSELQHLDLAYCTTVHKVQGAEFPTVIVVCHDAHRFMLERSLIYTALTRAKRLCLLIGTKRAIAGAAKIAKNDARRTTLAGLLKASVTQ